MDLYEAEAIALDVVLYEAKKKGNASPIWVANTERRAKSLRARSLSHGLPRPESDPAENLIKPGRRGTSVRIVETGKIYKTLTLCAKAIGGSHSGVSKTLKNERGPVYKGYHFEYV